MDYFIYQFLLITHEDFWKTLKQKNVWKVDFIIIMIIINCIIDDATWMPNICVQAYQWNGH